MVAKWNKIKIKINVTLCILSTLELELLSNLGNNRMLMKREREKEISKRNQTSIK